MSAVIGARVRLTVHDRDGVPHSATARIVSLASTWTPAIGAGMPRTWEALLLLEDANGEPEGFVVFDVCSCELLNLDDESATLTAQLATAQAALNASPASVTKLNTELADAKRQLANGKAVKQAKV